MAAGLSLRAENLEEFRRRLNASCTLTEEDLARKVMLDARLPLSYISEGLVESLKLLEPFGKGNERPLFGEQNLSLLSCRILGKRRNVLKLSVASGTRRMSAVCFCDADSLLQRLSAKGGEGEVKKLMAGLPNSLRVCDGCLLPGSERIPRKQRNSDMHHEHEIDMSDVCSCL